MNQQKKRQAPIRQGVRAISLFLIIIITFSTSAGCVDRGIVNDVVTKVKGNQEPVYVWRVLLSDKGSFTVSPNPNTNPDYQEIARKIVENVTNPSNPEQMVTNMKKILDEENLTMNKRTYTFFVINGTRNLNIEIEGIFKTFLGDTAPSGGYMEVTIKGPDGHSNLYTITQFQQDQKYTYPQAPAPGKWTVEVQGIGFQAPASLIYSGEYSIIARAEEPK